MKCSNIVIISNNRDLTSNLQKKLVLMRSDDTLLRVNTNNLSTIKPSTKILIVDTEIENFLAIISKVKEKYQAQIILLVTKAITQEEILKAYDIGIYDYCSIDGLEQELAVKIINCIRYNELLTKNRLYKNILVNSDILNSKNHFFSFGKFKQIFDYILITFDTSNSYLLKLTLDDKIKTKVSTNRLSVILKNHLRENDVIAEGKHGIYYVLVENTNNEEISQLLNKLQDLLGKEYPLRAGFSKVAEKSFEELDKITEDCIISAYQNDYLYVTFENDDEHWIINKNNNKKNFKLFKKAIDKKFEEVIIPIFYRCKKDLNEKLRVSEISQYANNIEGVFCIKTGSLKSELSIIHDGGAKFKIKIEHTGLTSGETTNEVVPLNIVTTDYIIKKIKQLANEHEKGIGK